MRAFILTIIGSILIHSLGFVSVAIGTISTPKHYYIATITTGSKNGKLKDRLIWLQIAGKMVVLLREIMPY